MLAVKKFWNRYGWHCIAILSILLILIGVIYKDKDSYSDYTNMYLFRKFPRSFVTKAPKAVKEIEYKKPNDPGYVSKGENECRRALESIFNRPFYKVRPDFLKNDVTGKNLELDLYNPDLKLSVEMNGRQHYHFTPYFHKNNEAFLNQRYRDEMKKVKCRENGVTIIEVPYSVKLENIEQFIREKCKELGYHI
jgi:hypothetical protein